MGVGYHIGARGRARTYVVLAAAPLSFGSCATIPVRAAAGEISLRR